MLSASRSSGDLYGCQIEGLHKVSVLVRLVACLGTLCWSSWNRRVPCVSQVEFHPEVSLVVKFEINGGVSMFLSRLDECLCWAG